MAKGTQYLWQKNIVGGSYTVSSAFSVQEILLSHLTWHLMKVLILILVMWQLIAFTSSKSLECLKASKTDPFRVGTNIIIISSKSKQKAVSCDGNTLLYGRDGCVIWTILSIQGWLTSHQSKICHKSEGSPYGSWDWLHILLWTQLQEWCSYNSC